MNVDVAAAIDCENNVIVVGALLRPTFRAGYATDFTRSRT